MNPFSVLRLLTNTRYLVRRLQRQFIVDTVRSKTFHTVVDIGVGKAPYKKLIVHREYIGIDIEDRGGVERVLLEDINEGLSLTDASADLVLCTEVLEHTKLPAKVLKEIYRILKPGGLLIVTVPFIWPFHEVPNDYYRYTVFGLKFLLSEAQFTDATISATNNYWYSVCQILLIRLRNPLWSPVVLLLNTIGYLCARGGQGGEFPLSIHASAYKRS